MFPSLTTFKQMSNTPGNILKKIEKAQEEQATELYLYWHPELTEFPEEVFALEQLEVLRVGGSFEENCTIEVIPDEIKSLKNLKELHFGFAQLTTLPDAILELKDLKVLSLPRNLFTEVPEQVMKMTQLETLSVAGNLLESFPEDMSAFTELKVLDISGNDLDSIPASVFQLEKLEKLYSNFNLLTEIPGDIKKVKGLKELQLMYNDISTIPDELMALPRIDQINLLCNPISTLPESMSTSNLTSMALNIEDEEAKVMMNDMGVGRALIYGMREPSKASEKYFRQIRYPKINNVPKEIIRQGTQAVKEFLLNLDLDDPSLNIDIDIDEEMNL